MNEPGGFSLVEVVFAMLILTLSVLSMAAGTGYVMTRMTMSNARTARVAALQAASAELRSLDWNDVDDACVSGHQLVSGRYSVACHVEDLGHLKRVMLVSVGPAFRDGHWDATVSDTAMVSIAEPVS